MNRDNITENIKRNQCGCTRPGPDEPIPYGFSCNCDCDRCREYHRPQNKKNLFMKAGSNSKNIEVNEHLYPETGDSPFSDMKESDNDNNDNKLDLEAVEQAGGYFKRVTNMKYIYYTARCDYEKLKS